MPYIQRFLIEGLAGQTEPCSAELNPYVNVFFGLNGSGKTSLLRILHSALKADAEILKDVPFTKATVVIHSFALKGDITYTIAKDSGEAAAEPGPDQTLANLYKLRSLLSSDALVWQADPEPRDFSHKYLPISRLYAGSSSQASKLLTARSTAEREEALESRFASHINALWKDYSTATTLAINKAQESGLARILEDVITPKEAGGEKSSADVNALLRSVSNFLERRGMAAIALTPGEFEHRYNTEAQLRSIVEDIDAVEKKIAELTKPQETFRDLINDLFRGTKTITLTDKEIAIDASDKRIDLSTLSSGEKQLIRIFVDLLAVGSSVILIDEPELSMHVDWQRKLVRSMRTLNSDAQIILATHSPEVMAELDDEEIFKL